MLIRSVAVAIVLAWPVPLLAQGDVDTAWVARFDSPANGADQMFGEDNFRVDGSGNVYVLGSSTGIGSETWDAVLIKYSPAGIRLWSRAYIGSGLELGQKLALDAAGFPHVCITEQSGDYEHIVTGKYTPDGDTVWIRFYNPPDSDNYPQALKIVSSGSVIVIANLASMTVDKGRILTYDSGGDLLWARSWPDSIDGTPAGDLASAADIDDVGNIYVATWASPGTIGLLKFNSDSGLVWARAQICGLQQSVAEVSVIGDRIYLAGGTACDGLYAPFTAVYTTDGDSLWTRRELFEGQTTIGGATDLAVGSDSAVYVIGNHSIASQRVVGAIKYDSHGNLLWKRTYERPGGIEAADASFGLAGDLYLSGIARVSPSGYRGYLLLKCNSSGDTTLTLWHQGWTECNANSSIAHFVDMAGNIHVGGYSQCTGGNYDTFTLKFSPRCSCFGDPACDGILVDVVDVVSVIGAAFRGETVPDETDCRRNRMDVDCSSAIDVLDVAKVIDVAFRGSDPSTEFCDPNEL